MLGERLTHVHNNVSRMLFDHEFNVFAPFPTTSQKCTFSLPQCIR